LWHPSALRLKQGAIRRASNTQRVCPHTAPFDLPGDPYGLSRAAADAVGVVRREALGVRQLAAALFLCPNNVPVPISPHSISPVIPMASQGPPRMLWALVSAKRLECGSLPPLCFYAQTTCLSPYLHARGSSTDFGNRGLKQGTICGPRRNPGATPKQRACHFIQLTPKDRAVVTALLAAREGDTETLKELAA